jgi:ubiquinone/menaquinone biosynthesis C-methylase UbiE
MGRALITIICGFPLALVLLHTVVRVLRYFYKFPIPEFLANAIDNPFRRKIQPPAETALRHGIQSGMRVLEVGPGNGTYSVEAARAVGEIGKLVTVDIEEKMIRRVARKITEEGITNIEARVANVYDLPYEDQFFDLIYMITVINEIPDQEKAFSEFFRVLSPAGTLVFSELLLDPDYPLAGTLVRRAEKAGFRLKERKGNFFYYTLIFEKDI